MNSNANSASEISNRRSLIGIRLQMLVDLHGKRVSEEGMGALRRVYGDALDRFTTEAISRGFSKAEQTTERFPTPKTMLEFCAAEMPSQTWRYNYKDTDGTDPETRAPIKIKLDPETGEKLFRAGDCPEGRAFLVKLRELARRAK